MWIPPCQSAGLRGIVLDDQLLLTAESPPLPGGWRKLLTGLSGQETVVIGSSTGRGYRVLDRPRFLALAKIKQLERELELGDAIAPEAWPSQLEQTVAWGDPETSVWPIGQGIRIAQALARRFATASAVVRSILRNAGRAVALGAELKPLAAGSALAQAHGTKYPIVQGPMTRVSDAPEFALAVAEGGALPTIAAAMFRGPQLRSILERTHALLGDRPWAVGIMGFLSPEIHREQMEELSRVRPRYCVVSGGTAAIALGAC